MYDYDILRKTAFGLCQSNESTIYIYIYIYMRDYMLYYDVLDPRFFTFCIWFENFPHSS